MAGKVEVGTILSETFSIAADNAREIAIYTVVIGGLAALGIAAGLTVPSNETMSYGFMVEQNDAPGSILFQLFTGILSLVAGYLLIKRFLASRNALKSDANRFWPYFGAMILSVIGIVIGIILLIIPGLFLMVRWSATQGYAVGAQRGVVDSLKASWNATSGHGWQIFFAGLIYLVLMIVLAGVIGGIFLFLGTTIGGMVSALVDAAVTGISFAFAIAVYVLVNDEGENLQEVFE